MPILLLALAVYIIYETTRTAGQPSAPEVVSATVQQIVGTISPDPVPMPTAKAPEGIPLGVAPPPSFNPTVTAPDRLIANESLYTGGKLVSQAGMFVLVMQTDGNVVIYPTGHVTAQGAVWATWWKGRNGFPAKQLVMQGDGNLVAYGANRSVGWASDSNGRGGQVAILQDDGNFVIYGGNGVATWDAWGNHDPSDLAKAANVVDQVANVVGKVAGAAGAVGA